MSEYSDVLLAAGSRRNKVHKYRPAVLFLVPLVAILFQVYVPRFFEYLSALELPLLVTVYFALMRRQPLMGIFYGCTIGLVQDSLSHQPVGLFGIIKTLVGYFAASVSLKIDVANPAVRLFLGFFFYFFHQFFYWVLVRALLGQMIGFDVQMNLVLGVLNAAIALPMFHWLDKLKDEG
ncbi:MAG: rod shape-determining protein MreD [Bryobacter sp.]|jgi:rod shape-determining protein MreD|nr:rod shape-determining protein MreD [Bryobacter sp.]